MLAENITPSISHPNVMRPRFEEKRQAPPGQEEDTPQLVTGTGLEQV